MSDGRAYVYARAAERSDGDVGRKKKHARDEIIFPPRLRTDRRDAATRLERSQ